MSYRQNDFHPIVHSKQTSPSLGEFCITDIVLWLYLSNNILLSVFDFGISVALKMSRNVVPQCSKVFRQLVVPDQTASKVSPMFAIYALLYGKTTFKFYIIFLGVQIFNFTNFCDKYLSYKPSANRAGRKCKTPHSCIHRVCNHVISVYSEKQAPALRYCLQEP